MIVTLGRTNIRVREPTLRARRTASSGALAGTSGRDGWGRRLETAPLRLEYKGRRTNLDAAFDQLRQYALALENPPLLIVSDMARFRIRTNWTNSVSRTHEFELNDLADAAARDRLKWAFSDPDRLRPSETRQSLTERVAASFAAVAQALREQGHDPQAVAHFVNRLVFCMFAADVGLLPDHMFTRMLRHAGELFRAMAAGGRVGFETVDWFNGSLFNDDTTVAAGEDRPQGRARGVPTSTGPRSTRRSPARCSSAGSTRTSAPSSGPTTPTARRSCCSSSRWSSGRCSPSGTARRPRSGCRTARSGTDTSSPRPGRRSRCPGGVTLFRGGASPPGSRTFPRRSPG